MSRDETDREGPTKVTAIEWARLTRTERTLPLRKMPRPTGGHAECLEGSERLQAQKEGPLGGIPQDS